MMSSMHFICICVFVPKIVLGFSGESCDIRYQSENYVFLGCVEVGMGHFLFFKEAWKHTKQEKPKPS